MNRCQIFEQKFAFYFLLFLYQSAGVLSNGGAKNKCILVIIFKLIITYDLFTESLKII
jgi:hypothetical protein